MAEEKTNAMRILDRAKIAYQTYSYEVENGAIDGVSVAEKLGIPVEKVFKTLVAQGAGRQYYVFVVPVERELDLKKAAKAVAEKRVKMIPVKEINEATGYVRGGCSPLGMKKQYPTVLDGSCQGLETLVVSAGKIGKQIELMPQNLIDVIGATVADIVKE